MNTKVYRETQFDRLGNTNYSQYKTKIKIINPNGETNWINIEDVELENIKKLLLETNN